ncbi:hypothetical protein Taro_056788, partial [Colocasia esculenta]|nr:hypothetical protein [Colocasia esculenta]
MPIIDLSHTFHSASSSRKQKFLNVGSTIGAWMWHGWRDYIILPDEDTSCTVGRVEYMSWYWIITRRFIGRTGFNYDMRYEPRDHIERSLVEDDMISNITHSRSIAMQTYIDSVLSQVQRTDSSTSDAGPSEPYTRSS